MMTAVTRHGVNAMPVMHERTRPLIVSDCPGGELVHHVPFGQ